MMRTLLECGECGWVSIPPAGVAVVFHPCAAAQTRCRLVAMPDIEYPTLEAAWLDAFERGDYQHPTAEQARLETGEHGRRKDGTGRK